MMERIAVLSEVLHPPLDEGVRIFAAEIAAALARRAEVALVGSFDAEVKGLRVRGVLTDRWFLGRDLGRELRRIRPDGILYIPWTSLTPRTFVRAAILKRRARGAPLGIVAMQPRSAGRLTRIAAWMGAPARLFVTGPETAAQAAALGLPFLRLEGGIDLARFRPLGEEAASDLRRRLGLPISPYLVLHVGHLKSSRGVLVLKSLQALEWVQTVLIASTSTEADAEARRELQRAGVRVIDRHVEEIEAYYRSADCYVFPVTSSLDAVELPLSVLEAISCNLPIVTTRFGGLTSLLSGGPPGVTFVSAVEEVPRAVMAYRRDRPRTDLRDRLAGLTWDVIGGAILAALEEARPGRPGSGRGEGRR